MPADLVIVFDALTPRLLGCYGGPWRTPAIDRLAATSTVFDAAFEDGLRGIEPNGLDESDQLLRLPGLAWPPSTNDEALVDRIDPDVWHQLRSHPRVDEEAASPLDLVPTLGTVDWEVLLEESDRLQRDAWCELALTTAALEVDAIDRQLAALWTEIPPEEHAITLVSLTGWTLPHEADPLLDVGRHVPAMQSRPGSPARRELALTTPAAVLDELPPSSEPLRFDSPDGASVRDRDALFCRQTDAYGQTTERLFAKPADRFNACDISREQPGLVDDYATKLDAQSVDG